MRMTDRHLLKFFRWHRYWKGHFGSYILGSYFGLRYILLVTMQYNCFLWTLSVLCLLVIGVLGFAEQSSEAHIIAKYFNFLKFDMSKCPKETWLKEMQRVDSNPDKLFIDIGFNKGYNFAKWMSLWAPKLGINRQKWFESIKMQFPNIPEEELCGYCEDCKGDIVDSRALVVHKNSRHKGHGNRSLILIGLDVNPTTVDLVANVTSRYQINNIKSKIFDHSLPSVFAYNVAASETTGNAADSVCTGLWDNCTASQGSQKSLIKSIRLDDFFKAIATAPSPMLEGPASLVDYSGYVDDPPAINSVEDELAMHFDFKIYHKRVVDMLVVRLGGISAQVLRGAMGHMKRNKLRCIVFEYHSQCPWPKTPLINFLKELNTVNRYICYFEGQGRLFRLNGFLDPLFEIHEWSNIICIHRNDVWFQVLDGFRIGIVEATKQLKENDKFHFNYTVSHPSQEC